MNKETLKEIKKQLQNEKLSVEQELSRFAKKDIKPRGDWDTQFPQVNGESGKASEEALEDKAERLEEYERLLPAEFALEKKLKNINLALEKIGKGTYGICEKCKKEISQKRLAAIPEARFCINCQK